MIYSHIAVVHRNAKVGDVADDNTVFASIGGKVDENDFDAHCEMIRNLYWNSSKSMSFALIDEDRYVIAAVNHEGDN